MLLWATPSATPLALSDTARLEKARSQTHDCDATAKRLHAFRLTQKKKTNKRLLLRRARVSPFCKDSC